jgi:hypothetical protein
MAAATQGWASCSSVARPAPKNRSASRSMRHMTESGPKAPARGSGGAAARTAASSRSKSSAVTRWRAVRTLCISTRRIGSRAWCAGSWSCPQTGSAVCKPAQTNEASREVLDEHCRTRRCRCQRGSATRRSFGNRGLRPARPPGPFLPRLRPGPWRPLFRPNPTSLSTSVDTGDRGASDRKPDDNAGAQCGARECRQGQDHDRSPLLPGNDNPQARALSVDMRCQSDA